MITMPDEEELNLKEEILRPEIFRIVAKIRNNEERKKLAKETKLRYKFKAKWKTLSMILNLQLNTHKYQHFSLTFIQF